jgi:hypothetical protein
LRIVLDSNFFISHQFDLTAPDFQILARAAGLGVATLVVPEVVVAEVERKFHDFLVAEADKVSKAEALIERWTGRAPAPAVDVATLSGQFNARFSDWRKKNNVVVPPTRAVSSEALVARALKRQKPFRDNGDVGMRDAIIWETLIQLAADDEEEIALLSRNTRDFADKDGMALHPDLAEEAKTKAKADVTYHPELRSLRDVILDEAIAEAQEEEDLEVAKKFAKEFNFVEAYGSQLVEALEGSLVETLPVEFDSPSIPHLDPPDEVIVDEAALGLGDRKVELSVTLVFEVQAEGFAIKSDAYMLTTRPGIDIETYDWNEWTSTVAYVDKVAVDVSVVVDATGPRITGFQVDDIVWEVGDEEAPPA